MDCHLGGLQWSSCLLPFGIEGQMEGKGTEKLPHLQRQAELSRI